MFALLAHGRQVDAMFEAPSEKAMVQVLADWAMVSPRTIERMLKAKDIRIGRVK
jgi:transcriptional regulator GlxA family with amidase domain